MQDTSLSAQLNKFITTLCTGLFPFLASLVIFLTCILGPSLRYRSHILLFWGNVGKGSVDILSLYTDSLMSRKV